MVDGDESEEYPVSDLAVTRGVDEVRRRPEAFIGRKSQLALAQALSNGVLQSDGACTVVRREGWWIVAADHDWIDHYRGEASVEEYFGGSRSRLFPNFVYYEVFTAILADPVLTATPEQRWVIKGEAFEERVIEWVTAAAPNWARLVAFRWDEADPV